LSRIIEARIEKIPVMRNVMHFTKSITLPWLQGLSLYDLLELYFIGVAQGAIAYRAGAIAWSFFMSLFPFALFILNLIPYIPIDDFQADFLRFVEQSVPPQTYEAIASILNDILNNSHSGLLSWGIVLAILLMSNGLNAIMGGFETSRHVIIKRGFVRQYLVALGMSLLLSMLLIITIASIVVFEIGIQQTKIQDVLSDRIPLLSMGRYAFVVLMILLTTSVLFKFGTKRDKNRSFISIGSVFTTILIILSSYFFGIWVVKFASYNELYGSIGTLLIMMFYIWINCMILLLGFELNGTINKLKKKSRIEQGL